MIADFLQKLAIHQFIIDLNLSYTFVQVGWWPQLMLPYPHGPKAGRYESLTKEFVCDGNVKVAFTLLPNIGTFVARIIEL